MASTHAAPAKARTYTRFSLAARLQHAIMLLSFTSLAVTGLAQKFALSPVSLFIVRLGGGIENLRFVHHGAATLLILVAIYHLVEIGNSVFVLRSRMSMLPSVQDIRDAWKALTYNLGLGKDRPQFGRYGFEEKAEYWALVWGILIMAITGFMMWNPLATVSLLPGEFIPAAKTAHGAEAILAVLAIIVWHMYGVHLRRFNRSMWTGKLTEDEMLHEHPLELADLKAGTVGQLPSANVIRRRQRIYYPIAAVAAAGLLFALYGFIGGEQTAITTSPPPLSTAPVFVPQTPTPLPPTPTRIPSPSPAPATEGEPTASAALAWGDVGPIFAGRCVMCHGPSLASKGLSLDTYAGALKGGADGPVVVPGDADSRLLAIQSGGGHPGQLSDEELALVRAWIEAGALEQ